MKPAYSYQLIIDGQAQRVVYTSLEALLLDPDNPVKADQRNRIAYLRRKSGYPVDLGEGIFLQQLVVLNVGDVRKKAAPASEASFQLEN